MEYNYNKIGPNSSDPALRHGIKKMLAFCCLNTLIAYGCFAEALNLWDASKVSAVLALAPLFTIATLKVIVIINPEYAFTDRLSNLSVLGAVLLIVGSALTALMPLFLQRR